MEHYLARQPVVDARGAVLAYDLCHGAGPAEPGAGPLDPDHASRDVLANVLSVVGIEGLGAGAGRPLLVRATPALLDDAWFTLLDPSAPVLLDLPAAVVECRDILRRMAELVWKGHRFAVSGCCADTTAAAMSLASVVRFDADLADAAAFVARVHVQVPNAAVWAMRVETAQQYAAVCAAGCEGFLGYWLQRPEPVGGGVLRTGELARLALIAAVHDPRSTPQQLRAVIEGDPTLVFKLLRYAQSAWYAHLGIRTVERAVFCLGLDVLRTWATLIAMDGDGEARADLIESALVRAHLCRELARLGDGDRDGAFLAGLLSVLDALLGMPMADIVARLPLAAEVAGALAARTGTLGQLLDGVLAWERADWPAAERLGLAGRLRDAYLGAVLGAGEVLTRLRAAAAA